MKAIGDSKQCSRCRNVLPLGAFGLDASTPDGLLRQCRSCRAEVHRDWFQKVRAERVKQVAEYYAAHAEQKKAVERARYRQRKAAKQGGGNVDSI